MKPEAYRRNLAARAFDVARYLLFWGIPTNVGQVTSIRTLEKQIRRLKASEYQELRDLGDEIAQPAPPSPIAFGTLTPSPSPSRPPSRATPNPMNMPPARTRTSSGGPGKTCRLIPAQSPRASISHIRPIPQPISWPRCCIR